MTGFRNYSLTKGGNLTIGSIRSPDFAAGSTGWAIFKDGSAEFNSVTLPTGSGGATIFVQGTAPTANHVNDLWVDTANANQILTWNGSAWAASQLGTAAIASGAITAALLAVDIVVAGIVNGTTITGATIIGDGTSGQTLIYSGTPAAGNLIASVSGFATTDAYGNKVNQGIWAYNSNGSSMGMVPVGGQTQLNMTPAGATKTTGDTTLYAGVANAGLANESLFLTLSSGSSNSERAAAVQLNGEPADASASENILVALGAQDLLYIDRTGVQTFHGTPLKVYGGGWVNMVLSNGWTVGSGGVARYKEMPDGTVAIQLNNLVPGTITDGTVIWIPPTSLVPVTEQKLPLIASYSSAPAYGSMPFLYTNGSTGLEVFDLRGTVSAIHTTTGYHLD